MNTILAFVVLTAAAPPVADPSPLQCVAPVANRGEIKAGAPLLQTFEVVHRGTAGTIAITGIETGCGCVRKQIDTNLLQPGQTAKVTLDINTLTQPVGANRWLAVVHFRHDLPAPAAPKTGSLTVLIVANLTREVTVAPPQVGFSCVGEATQVVTISDSREKPLKIVRAEASTPHLTAAIAPPTPGPGKLRTQTVTLKLVADAPVGHRDETIVLLTDDPGYPEFRIPVRVLKRSPQALRVAPEAISIRFAPAQADISSLVQIRTGDGKNVAVSGVESDHPGVSIKWSPAAGPVAAIRITVTSGAGESGGCTIRAKLSEPAGEEVVIPVTWTGGNRKP